MAERAFGQYCGIARALELVGERWAMLIVRDLILGPKRFTDLRRGLPRIPSNVLSARLKELEQTGIVQRRVMPRPAASVVYELTPYGHELDDVLLQFGRWGARSLGLPQPFDIVTCDSLQLALQATFQQEHARTAAFSFQLHVADVVIHGRVADGKLVTGDGPLPGADLKLEPGMALKALMADELSADDALQAGQVHIEGDPRLFARWVALFHLDPAPPVPTG
jgi:DNA-binding HxlR family transcriptional regulator